MNEPEVLDFYRHFVDSYNNGVDSIKMSEFYAEQHVFQNHFGRTSTRDEFVAHMGVHFGTLAARGRVEVTIQDVWVGEDMASIAGQFIARHPDGVVMQGPFQITLIVINGELQVLHNTTFGSPVYAGKS